MKILGIIPARGGSKGIKDKNLIPLAGKPLIAWTIKCARDAGIFHRIIVSTDSKKISDVAQSYGAEVPFLRPAELATHKAGAIEVLIHSLKWLEEHGNETYDVVYYLQPTSPLRQPVDVKNSLETMIRKKAEAVVSVCEAEHHPLWAGPLPPDGNMAAFFSSDLHKKNRQELPPYYRLNGAIYCSKVESFLARKDWYGDKTYACIMTQERSADIDNLFDIALTEFLISKGKLDPWNK